MVWALSSTTEQEFYFLDPNNESTVSISFSGERNPCESDGECPDAEVCHNNTCRTACTSNQECQSSDEICHLEDSTKDYYE